MLTAGKSPIMIGTSRLEFTPFRAATASGGALEIIVARGVQVTASKFVAMTPPESFRKLNLHDGPLAYSENEGFRREVRYGRIWTGQIGLRTEGPRKITRNGNSRRVSHLSYEEPERNLMHYKGSKLVAFCGAEECGSPKRACLDGNVEDGAQITPAYARRLAPRLVAAAELRRRGREELKAMIGVVKPEAIVALSELSRVGEEE